MVGAISTGALVTAAQVRSQEGIRISLNEQKANMGGSIAEMLGNLAYIRASGMRQAEEKRLEDCAEKLRKTEFDHHKYMMSFSSAKELIEGLGFTVVVGIAIDLALRGEISSGDILSLSMLYMKAAQPLSKMHGVFDGMHEAVIKIGALSSVRELPVDPGLNGSLSVKSGSEVPLRANNLGVTLTRGVGGESHVLQNLSLELKRGKVVGLAGTSGSGKSTLLKVALGLIPDYGGSMTMFGTEIKDLSKLSLSQHIAYAQQEPFVLTGTLRENLLLTQPWGLEGKLAIDDAMMWRALDRSCLGQDDYNWAHGLDTHIHEGGRNLSGGQRQRLALARIFLQQNAEFIVLDESTSALDNATESRVIKEIHAHAAERQRTVIMVAHRLTSLRQTDRVIVMDEGKVVQDGNYTDLSKNPGIFFDLLQHNR
jgi:ATP-binding cassette subfamily B protein